MRVARERRLVGDQGKVARPILFKGELAETRARARGRACIARALALDAVSDVSPEPGIRTFGHPRPYRSKVRLQQVVVAHMSQAGRVPLGGLVLVDQYGTDALVKIGPSRLDRGSGTFRGVTTRPRPTTPTVRLWWRARPCALDGHAPAHAVLGDTPCESRRQNRACAPGEVGETSTAG